MPRLDRTRAVYGMVRFGGGVGTFAVSLERIAGKDHQADLI